MFEIHREAPIDRETCEKLLEHGVFKDTNEWLKIVREMSLKCFAGGKCANEYLVKVMNKNERHVEGSLGADSVAWKEFLSETSKFPELKPQYRVCSSIVHVFGDLQVTVLVSSLKCLKTALNAISSTFGSSSR